MITLHRPSIDGLGHQQRWSGSVAVIGNYPPRRCGIATFTSDLVTSLRRICPTARVLALPMTDREEGYAYPPEVRFEIDDRDQDSYRRAADFLNINAIDVVCLQHEFGIFGGEDGRYILDLLDELRMPVITTLHTILRDPSPGQRQVLTALAARSARLVTMSHHGEEFLRSVYGVPAEKIAFVPHGIHDVPFVDPNFHKDTLGVEGRKVLLTFGLLSPGKGIEQMIQALPAIVAEHPEVTYLVVGATHPHVLAREEEAYRLRLQRLAQQLGVTRHLVFHDRFVDLDELLDFIGACDLYVTPYLDEAQITSGTLAYAIGAGKAVVSTPYWYATELLAEDRGRLVGFRDPAGLAAAINDLLGDDVARNAMRKRAYGFSRSMLWDRVAERYHELFRLARAERGTTTTIAGSRSTLLMPEIRLDALLRMTDGTGLLQHAVLTTPNRDHGYSIDDNARALVLCTRLERERRGLARIAQGLASRYLAFIHHAWNPTVGRFRNFLGYDRRWLEEAGSEDAHGRTLWALGTVIGQSTDQSHRQLAVHLFEQALKPVRDFTSPRTWAFTILGLSEYLRTLEGDCTVRSLHEELAGRLHASFLHHDAPDWHWFENSLTYCNARLPQALLLAGELHERDDWREAGLVALRWLTGLQTAGRIFDPIGSDGWYVRGGERAVFDQQPVEAYNQVSACRDAWRITGDRRWLERMQQAFDWFLGANRLDAVVAVPATGGCRDGLHPDRLNENQGAESILSFLLARLDLGTLQEPAAKKAANVIAEALPAPSLGKEVGVA